MSAPVQSIARASFTEASRAYHAHGWIVCPECEGVSFFYSDAGPSGREYPCSECDGNGGWYDQHPIDPTICIAEQIERDRRVA